MNHWKKPGNTWGHSPKSKHVFWFGLNVVTQLFGIRGGTSRPHDNHFAMSRCSAASNRSTCRSNDTLGNPGPHCELKPGNMVSPWNQKKTHQKWMNMGKTQFFWVKIPTNLLLMRKIHKQFPLMAVFSRWFRISMGNISTNQGLFVAQMT